MSKFTVSPALFPALYAMNAIASACESAQIKAVGINRMKVLSCAFSYLNTYILVFSVKPFIKNNLTTENTENRKYPICTTVGWAPPTALSEALCKKLRERECGRCPPYKSGTSTWLPERSSERYKRLKSRSLENARTTNNYNGRLMYPDPAPVPRCRDGNAAGCRRFSQTSRVCRSGC